MRQIKISNSITNRESLSLERYFQEISKVNMLKPEEEAELAKMAKEGDQFALEKLTKANLRFVVSVAKQYQNQGLSLSDLINEGNIGLMKAAQRFDETKGFKFISYGVWRVRQAILQALNEKARIIRIPQNKFGSFNKMSKALNELEQLYEREPTSEELAELLDISLDEVDATIGVSSRHISLDAPFEEGEDNSLLNVLSIKETEDYFHLESLRSDIANALSSLTARQRDVIIYYFGLNENKLKSLEEIGDMFNLTRERTRQIKDKAISKLRQKYKQSILKTYLG